MERKRRKTTISVTLSPHLVEKIDDVVQENKYAGQSDLVSIALTEHLFKNELQAAKNEMVLLLVSIFDNEELIKLLNIPQLDKASRIDALCRKGIVCIELGEIEEAKACFEKAKSLESGQSTEPPKKRAAIDPQKEKEDCLNKLCPEPRELTPEEARKAAEAKEYYRKFIGEDDSDELLETLTRKS